MIKKTTLVFLLALPLFAFGQINNMEFGKNRVQFHRFFDDWDEYESDNFITYWYGQGRFVGQATVQMAEMDFEEIQKTLEYRLNDKMEIIVFTDLTDMHQSNIGASETFETKDGTVKVVGEKIFVYFDGDHTHLRHQIRQGIATVFINAMLFGSNLQEVVQNAISLNLPEWFKAGLVSYMGSEWSTEDDDKLRDVFLTKKYKNFNRFAIAEPRLAGHAFWFYVAQQFGKANVSNLLYLTRINRSLDDAVMYLFGSAFDPMALSCMEFYKKRYEREALDMKTTASKSLKISNKRKLPIPQVKLSPDGKQIAYVQNEIGKWKVYIQDVSSGKRSLILRGGTRNPFQAADYNYPLLAWNPDNQRLAVVYEKRDIVYFFEKNLKDKKEKKPKTVKFNPDAQRVFSIDYLNSKDMVISANIRGFSDILIFNTYTTAMRQLSNDLWDDLDAVAVNLRGKKGIIFSSNRPNKRWDSEKLDSINPTSKFDLFYKDLEDTSKNLVRLSSSIDADERQPIAVDSTYFSFLSDESGIFNRQMGFLRDIVVRVDTAFFITNLFGEKAEILIKQDSARTFAATQKIDSTQIRPVTETVAIVRNNSNASRNILQQSSAPRVGKVAELIYTEGVPKISVKTLQTDTVKDVSFTNYWMWKKRRATITTGRKKPNESVMKVAESPKLTPTTPQNSLPMPTQPKPDTTPTKKKVDIDNYVFQSEFDNEEKPKTTEVTTAAPKPIVESLPTPQTPPSVISAPSSVPSTSTIVTTDAASVMAKANAKPLHQFKTGRITPYRLKFRSDSYTTRMDNGLLFGGLDSYAGTQQQTFSTPPVGLLMKGNFKDLLEDYQLEAGIRVPITSFNGYEAFAFWDDRKHRIDKRFAIYNRSLKTNDNESSIVDNRKTRTQTTLAQYELRYPFDQFQRVQVSTTLRSDRYSSLSTDSVTLRTPILKEQRIGARIEWVFDNAIDVDLNIKNGSRAKVWVDWVKRFDFDVADKSTFKFNKGFMGVIGFDARHYERVLRHSVLALRAAGATSFGEQKTLYILGGVDNQLLASFNNDVTIPAGDYAFQTLAANMRGFQRNIRNGTSNVLFNSELRVPIFKYLSQKPLTSSFLKNFQIVGFVDAGTAWHGNNPFNRNNPLNTVILPRDNNPLTPVVLTVNYFKDPIVFSYGTGIRMLLFGYMLRADYGWGIETRQIQKPKLHIALGTDF
jgi:hypothetical protein